MKLQFLGAARQVTGSQYYVEADGAKAIVDCGMFQERNLLERNWEPSPLPLREVDAVLLTHAHLDHCGLAPKLVRDGLRAPIYATSASADLVEIVWRDSAQIQLEDASFKQKRHRQEGRQSKYPVQPLYTMKDVERTLPLLRPAPYFEEVPINDGLSAVFHEAGHILGSAMIELKFADGGRTRRILFSGDIGQRDKPFVRDPSVFDEADVLVMESTYGQRDHENHGDLETQLAKIVREAFDRGGKLIIPIFAIERAQELVYHLSRLLRAKQIPETLVFLDSPMAADVVEVFREHRECYDEETKAMIASGGTPLGFPGLRTLRTADESKQINALHGPAIIMATSGMCVAGRIKHHLAHHISDPTCTVLFVGYQAVGTLGRQILDGQKIVRIHGFDRKVRAHIEQLHGASGHADRKALMEWLRHFKKPPRQLFITHGEETSALGLAEEIRNTFGWEATVPQWMETVTIT